MTLSDNTEGPRRKWPVWLLPFVLTLGLVLWGLVIYVAIPEKPRAWAYGTLPYVPGEFYSSTERPPPGEVPPQIEFAPPLSQEEKP